MKASHRAEQCRARIEPHLFDDLLDRKLATAQHSRRNRCSLALKVLVRRDVVNVFEQTQEVMPRQERSSSHILQHERLVKV